MPALDQRPNPTTKEHNVNHESSIGESLYAGKTLLLGMLPRKAHGKTVARSLGLPYRNAVGHLRAMVDRG